jgi:hypothetical protein
VRTDAGSQGALQDDCSGRIVRIAVQIEDYPFNAKHADKKAAYESLLKSFAADITLSILVDDGAMATTVQAWLDRLNLECKPELVRAPGRGVSNTGAWIRDAFLCATKDGVRRYLKPHISKMHADQADWLGACDGTEIVSLADLALDGGDSLVGADFRLVGNNAIKTTCRIAGHQCSYDEAVARFANLDKRRFFPVGYRRRDIERKSPWSIDQKAARELTGGTHELVEDWGHIDLIVSITNRKNADGADILLVAETVLSAKPGSDETREHRRLDALAKYLRERGFEVIRNPAPFDRSRLQTLCYNNTIMQSNPRTVWLPQFADADPQYRGSDELNVQIWQELGYKVIPVPGWMAYLGSRGSIRCATNVLERV